MKKFLSLLACLVLTALPLWAESYLTLNSPTSGLTAEFTITSKVPYLIVRDAAGKQVAKVRLGVKTSTANLATGLTFVSATEPEVVEESYVALHGKRSSVNNTANSAEVTVANSSEQQLKIEVRAYEDGVVFRYKLDAEPREKISFSSEATNYQIPTKAHRWLQPFNTSYEADFPYQASGGRTGTWGYPALFEADGTFTLITEANIGRNYSSTHLDNSASGGQYQVSYPFDYEGYNKGATNPTCTGPWTSPWRVMIIGSLATVVESTLVEDVSEPCAIANTDFVQPGRAAWIYWAYNHSSKDYQICTQYVDLAVKMGWEYVLIDWEWEQMSNGGGIEDAVRYASKRGVKPLLWYHSNDAKMQNTSQRRSEFAWLKRIGVKGVKIDFFESDKQHTMQYFADILEDAAKYQIMVNFHGCTIPRGWSRTYPHLMSQEAVFGAEQYNNGGTMTTQGARINCLLPYTRNVVGPMDYTPVAFTDSQHPHTTTFAHELALSVAFESGIQHWADRPEGFYALPLMARRHMMQVPVAWDETRFVDGYPEKSFIIARRKGDCWYVAALNGTNKAASYDIPLSFLRPGTHHVSCIADGTEARKFQFSTHTLSRDSQFHIDCLPRGGCVLILQPTDSASVPEGAPSGFTPDDLSTLIQQSQSLLEVAEQRIGDNSGDFRKDAVKELSKAALLCSNVLDAQGTNAELYSAYLQLLVAYSNFEEYGHAEGGLITITSKMEDITREYLVEPRNFSRDDDGDSEPTTRFGLLAEPWQVTENIINQDNGSHGGFDSFEGGRAISVEKWDGGEPAMVNDKIYQTTSQPVPAGDYYLHISVTCRSGLGNSGCILKVARGNRLPNKGEKSADLLASFDMTKTDYSGEYDVCKFHLDEPAVLTIGWVLNLPQNEGNHAFRVTAIRLKNSAGQDLSATYLGNYQNIQRCDRSYVRFGHPTHWQVADFCIPQGNDGTKAGIDRYPGYDCLSLGVWDDASAAISDGSPTGFSLADARIYRQVTLPAGRYYFCASYEACYNLSSAYMFASTVVPDGELSGSSASSPPLPLTASQTLTSALAYYALPGTPASSDFYGITFTLSSPTELCLGWNADLTTAAQQEFRVRAVRLLRDTTYDPVGVKEVKSDEVKGEKWASAVFDLVGRPIATRLSSSPSPLPKGVYIVGGRKVMVK